MKYFEVIEDKREAWKVRHNLLEIIFMAIVATICRAETIDGCVVTIDAMGTQKEISKKIRTKKADYVLAVKENQPALYDDIKDYFEAALTDTTGEFKWEILRQCEKGHGRIEKRQYYYSTDIEWLEQKKDWKDIKGIWM